jgi:hypothetical protein
VAVVVAREAVDVSGEVTDVAESPTAAGPLGDDVRPDLDLVKP